MPIELVYMYTGSMASWCICKYLSLSFDGTPLSARIQYVTPSGCLCSISYVLQVDGYLAAVEEITLLCV